MIKAVLDTNVYISAIVFGGRPMEILRLAKEKKIKIFISEHITGEIARVLKEKFKWQDRDIDRALRRTRRASTSVFPREHLSIIKKKRSDNRILECALEGEAHFIVSGDKKHILPLKNFRGIKILSPAEFLEIFK